jgi:hydroxymethylpyrimidine pyrophosphatase-like HAD family hydrolase
MEITRENIEKSFLDMLGLATGEMLFESLWNHFVDRGDFNNVIILDGKPLYNNEGYHLKPIYLDPDAGDSLYDIFYTPSEVPEIFRKKMGNPYFITGKIKFVDDIVSDLVIYGKRRNKNGEWKKSHNQLIVYKIRPKKEEE